jgi:hypothetical protein
MLQHLSILHPDQFADTKGHGGFRFGWAINNPGIRPTDKRSFRRRTRRGRFCSQCADFDELLRHHIPDTSKIRVIAGAMAWENAYRGTSLKSPECFRHETHS